MRYWITIIVIGMDLIRRTLATLRQLDSNNQNSRGLRKSCTIVLKVVKKEVSVLHGEKRNR